MSICGNKSRNIEHIYKKYPHVACQAHAGNTCCETRDAEKVNIKLENLKN